MSGIQSQENLLEMLKKMIDVDLPLSFPGYRTHINIDPYIRARFGNATFRRCGNQAIAIACLGLEPNPGQNSPLMAHTVHIDINV